MAMKGKIEVRCDREDELAFEKRCDKLGVEAPAMLREIVQAFATNRLVIKPTRNQSVIIRGIHDVT